MEREEPRVYTTDDIIDTDDIVTTEEAVEDIDDVVEEGGSGRERPARRSDRRDASGLPEEDQEVNSVGSYESWNLSGQSLDAAGAGMTGDSGADSLDGTGFEDDTDLNPPGNR